MESRERTNPGGTPHGTSHPPLLLGRRARGQHHPGRQGAVRDAARPVAPAQSAREGAGGEAVRARQPQRRAHRPRRAAQAALRGDPRADGQDARGVRGGKRRRGGGRAHWRGGVVHVAVPGPRGAGAEGPLSSNPLPAARRQLGRPRGTARLRAARLLRAHPARRPVEVPSPAHSGEGRLGPADAPRQPAGRAGDDPLGRPARRAAHPVRADHGPGGRPQRVRRLVRRELREARRGGHLQPRVQRDAVRGRGLRQRGGARAADARGRGRRAVLQAVRAAARGGVRPCVEEAPPRPARSAGAGSPRARRPRPPCGAVRVPAPAGPGPARPVREGGAGGRGLTRPGPPGRIRGCPARGPPRPRRYGCRCGSPCAR